MLRSFARANISQMQRETAKQYKILRAFFLQQVQIFAAQNRVSSALFGYRRDERVGENSSGSNLGLSVGWIAAMRGALGLGALLGPQLGHVGVDVNGVRALVAQDLLDKEVHGVEVRATVTEALSSVLHAVIVRFHYSRNVCFCQYSMRI